MLNERAQSISYLGMQNSFDLTDVDFIDAIVWCPNILHLDISSCHSLGDESINAVSLYLTHLLSLNISDCRLTDAILLSLAAHRQQAKHTLERLFACACQGLTGAGFNAVLHNCHRLHTRGIGLVSSVVNSLDVQLLGNIRTLQTDFVEVKNIHMILPFFYGLQHLYMGDFVKPVEQLDTFELSDTILPDLRNLVFGSATSCHHSNSFWFVGGNCQKSEVLQAPQLDRPTLHIRYEFGNDWPINLINVPL